VLTGTILHTPDLRFLSPSGRFRTNNGFQRYANGLVERNCAANAWETPMIGLIRERNWYGIDGMEHIRTRKEPKQAIPTFIETINLLMKVSAA
jgi:hypothetical protein